MPIAKKPAAKKSTKKNSSTNKSVVSPLLKQLLQAGAHFGQRTERWNPKMAPYIYSSRGGVHIIDLIQTADQLGKAEKAAYELSKSGGQILFVGTKRQAKPIIEKYAKAANMPYVTHRWLGGMLTNLETIKLRIARLKKLETQKAEDNFAGVIKKEKLILEEQIRKLSKMFDGVREMYGLPAAIFVVDMPREHTAILEARKLNIPIIAIADTNANPELADFLIASNDDALKAIELITSKIADACLKGYNEYKAKAASENATNEKELQ